MVRSPGASRTRCRLPVAPAVGCQASRSVARTDRSDSLTTSSTDSAGWLIRTAPTGRRETASESSFGARR
jgi:hypothetical protein